MWLRMNDKTSVVDVCVYIYIYIYLQLLFLLFSLFINRSRVLTWSEREYITGENDIMGLKIFNLRLIRISSSRSQWPRGLRRGSSAAHLLGLRVRIQPEPWMSVSS